MRLALGVDLGGTKTAVGMVDADGVVVARVSASTPAAAGPIAVLDTVAELVARLRASNDAEIVGVGVGAAGVIDPALRRVLSSTDSLPGWAETELGSELEKRIGLPVATVNDVHAHALGEANWGAGRGQPTVLMVAAGTGIGGALVLDGRVHSGRSGVSGHFGHIPASEALGRPCACGGSGHLEAVASGPSLCALYREYSGESAVDDGRIVFERADRGDEHAARAIETAATALGRGIGGLVNSLDPDVVVIGGGLAAAGERWWRSVRRAASAECLPITADTPLVAASLGADSAIIGAASLISIDTGLARHRAQSMKKVVHDNPSA